jgi:hypothetical protein
MISRYLLSRSGCDASPAIVTRHIERVSDKAMEGMHDRDMIIPPASWQPSKLDQA